MKKKYIFRAFLFFLGLLLFAGFYAVENVLPYSSIKPYKQRPRFSPDESGLKYERFSVKNDSITIQGLYFPNDTAHTTLIYVHGITNNKESSLMFAKQMHEIGCNVVAVDLRAHGKSDGTYCTFGYYEKYDLQKVIDYVAARSNTKNIGIQGHSLGGAIAIQTLALDNRLKFGIIESTYTTFPDVMMTYMENWAGFSNRFLVNRVAAKSAKIANFELSQVNPIEYCPKITVPILYSHGTCDERIPFEMGKKNFDKIASTDKYFYPIEGVGHNFLHVKGGEAYWNLKKNFILNYEKNNRNQPTYQNLHHGRGAHRCTQKRKFGNI